jgi:hypothetical protein
MLPKVRLPSRETKDCLRKYLSYRYSYPIYTSIITRAQEVSSAATFPPRTKGPYDNASDQKNKKTQKLRRSKQSFRENREAFYSPNDS